MRRGIIQKKPDLGSQNLPQWKKVSLVCAHESLVHYSQWVWINIDLVHLGIKRELSPCNNRCKLRAWSLMIKGCWLAPSSMGMVGPVAQFQTCCWNHLSQLAKVFHIFGFLAMVASTNSSSFFELFFSSTMLLVSYGYKVAHKASYYVCLVSSLKFRQPLFHLFHLSLFICSSTFGSSFILSSSTSRKVWSLCFGNVLNLENDKG